MAAAASTTGVPQFASLYVGDLNGHVVEAMLYEIFNAVGPVASVRICRDSVTRRSLGYAYVNFHAVADAERALDTLNYSNIKGRSCRIMWSQRDPSLRKSGVGNVYVKNLDRGIDNKALYDTFSLFGNILSCKVATDAKGRSRGFGFVHYETEEAAKQAIERVNGMQIGEKTVEVGNFQSRTERDKPEITNYTNLYVKNFPAEWDENKLTDVFGEFGNVTSAVIQEDLKDRKYAFVNFDSSENAKKAEHALHQKDMRTDDEKQKDEEEGKPEEGEKDPEQLPYLLYVVRAQSKEERRIQMREKFGPPAASQAPGRQQGANLYIKNLEDTTTDESLTEMFSPFGTITSAKVMTDEKGLCKGFGFVNFSTPEEATKAVTEMHLKVIQGKPLYVGLAEKKEVRQDRLQQRYSPGAGHLEGLKGQGMMGSMMGGGKCGKAAKGSKHGAMQMGCPQPHATGKGGPAKGAPQGMMGKGCPMPMMTPPHMMGKGMPGMMGGPHMMGKAMPPMPGMMGMPGKGTMPGMPGMFGPGMMGPGMMPMGKPGQMMPMIPAMGKGAQQTPAQQQASQPTPSQPAAALNAASVAAAPQAVQKQMLGEKLYPIVAKFHPELAGKITGMMLEMDNSELMLLLESEAAVKTKADEAIRVLETRSA